MRLSKAKVVRSEADEATYSSNGPGGEHVENMQDHLVQGNT